MPLSRTFSLTICFSLLLVFSVKADSGDVVLDKLKPYVSPRGLSRLPVIEQNCQGDKYCLAVSLRPYFKGPAEVRRTVHPSSDSIRRVTNLQSIDRSDTIFSNQLYVSLQRFGRNVSSAVLKVCGKTRIWQRIIIDLRDNEGGDPERMLKVAALFSKPATGVFYVQKQEGEKNHYSIPVATDRCHFKELALLIGKKTASSAEILASLLRDHAGATLYGSMTYGKNWLFRIVPLNHDWRLFLPAEEIILPGKELKQGIMADQRIPHELKERLDYGE